jgi:CubicO group peptidase (beta-lactamase class C family)
MRIATIAWTILCAASASEAIAREEGSSTIPDEPSIPASAAPELTRAELESWLDGLVQYSLATGDIAGGVVVVVKDGATLLQKGYGYADVEARRPVDPERTLFRAGSVAKLVTHTAVMQLVESGKLDLDVDIQGYLDFPVPSGFDAPVTLHNLMTHTGGFEELVRSLMASDPQRFPPLEEYVKATQPRRIFPPGQVPSYCNYCLTLQGYIVQRVSGEPFDDYLDRHIFGPLGMQHSTFRQPLPKALEADMSKGYAVASQPAHYFELVGPAPAGSLSTTGADMARFMLAHLAAQRGSEPSLIRPDTSQLMHSRMFRIAESGNGMAVGFFERDRNGRRVREHGGDTQYFHSQLALYLDEGVGLFMSFNSTGKEGATYKLRDALFEGFTDRYFPAPVPDEPTAATAVEHAQLVAGRYAGSRRAETTFFRLFTLLGESAITANEDGTITVPGLTALNEQPKRWREVGPFVWREVGGKERLVAQVQDGRVRQISADSLAGIMTFLPVPVGRSSAWIVPTISLAVGVLLLTVIAWPVAAILRRRRGIAFPLTGREALAYKATRIAAAVLLIFLLGWLLIVQAGEADLASYDGRLDAWFVLLYLLGFIGLVGAGVAVWNAWLGIQAKRAWSSTAWRGVLAVSCIAVVWFGFAFNLIRVTVQY